MTDDKAKLSWLELCQDAAHMREITEEVVTKFKADIDMLTIHHKEALSVLNQLAVFHLRLNKLNTSTIPEREPVDWDDFISEAEEAGSYAADALEQAQEAHLNADDIEGNVEALIQSTEQSISSSETASSAYQTLAEMLRDAKAKHTGNSA
jgi:hypothetical protein